MTIEQYPERPDESSRRVEAVFNEQSKLVRLSSNPIVQFLLGTAPWTGGLASVLSENAQQRQEARLREFLVSLAQEFEERWQDLEERLDIHLIYEDHYVARVVRVLDIVAMSDDEPKLRYLREYLISGVLRGQPDSTWQSVLEKYVSSLTGTHLVVLSVFYRVQGKFSDTQRLGRVSVGGELPLLGTAVSVELGLDMVLTRLVLADLESAGLLVDWADLGNDERARSAYSLSPSGRLLMRYLEQDW